MMILGVLYTIVIVIIRELVVPCGIVISIDWIKRELVAERARRHISIIETGAIVIELLEAHFSTIARRVVMVVVVVVKDLSILLEHLVQADVVLHVALIVYELPVGNVYRFEFLFFWWECKKFVNLARFISKNAYFESFLRVFGGGVFFGVPFDG